MKEFGALSLMIETSYQLLDQDKTFLIQQMVSLMTSSNGSIDQTLMVHQLKKKILHLLRVKTLVTKRLKNMCGALLQTTEMCYQHHIQSKMFLIQLKESSTPLGTILLMDPLMPLFRSLRHQETLETKKLMKAFGALLPTIRMFYQLLIQNKMFHIQLKVFSILHGTIHSMDHQMHLLNMIPFIKH
jgi:hypothetical protein